MKKSLPVPPVFFVVAISCKHNVEDWLVKMINN